MSRQVVLLREGPPKRRGAIIDALTGVFGVLLLITAGVLGETLPEEDIIPVQYSVDFPTNNTDAFFIGRESGQPVKSIVFNENRDPFTHGERKVIPFLVENDNVVSMTIQIFIPGDDVPSSRVDAFGFEIFDPNGRSIGQDFTVSTAEPTENLQQPDPTNPPTDPQPYDSTWVSRDVTFSHNYRMSVAPDRYFISGPDGQDVGLANALRYAIENNTLETAGTWTLEIQLRQTGDCPGPSTNPQDLEGQRREADCQKITTNRDNPNDGSRGVDDTNAVTIKSIRYDFYEVDVTPPA